MQSPYQDFLEGSEFGPRINFYGRIPQSFGFGQQQAVGNLFQPTFNRYLGDLGRQIQGGGAPTLSFNRFLNQSFNPQRESARGSYGPRLTSPARYFFDR